MFNFLKKKNHEFNVPEQALPYRLEELCDLFMHIAKEHRYSTVSSETIHHLVIHINKMYTNVPTTVMPNTPKALAITLNDLTGVVSNRYSNVTTIDEAIDTLIESNDPNDDVPYPIVVSIIGNLIPYINSNSVLADNLIKLKWRVKHSHHLYKQLYRVNDTVNWSNTTGYTTTDLISELIKIQEERSNMHTTFDDVINLLTNGITTLVEEQKSTIYLARAQSYMYHLKATYKNNVKVSQYLDKVNSRLTGLSMKNEDSMPLNEFMSFIYTAKHIHDYNTDIDTMVTDKLYTHDHIPTAKELNQQQATKQAQWVLEAKGELLLWFNQIVGSESRIENKAVLDSYHYPKAYELLTIQPEYLTDKGYRLNHSSSSVYKGIDYVGNRFIDVPSFIVTWDRDTNLIKTILY